MYFSKWGLSQSAILAITCRRVATLTPSNHLGSRQISTQPKAQGWRDEGALRIRSAVLSECAGRGSDDRKMDWHHTALASLPRRSDPGLRQRPHDELLYEHLSAYCVLFRSTDLQVNRAGLQRRTASFAPQLENTRQARPNLLTV